MEIMVHLHAHRVHTLFTSSWPEILEAVQKENQEKHHLYSHSILTQTQTGVHLPRNTYPEGEGNGKVRKNKGVKGAAKIRKIKQSYHRNCSPVVPLNLTEGTGL